MTAPRLQCEDCDGWGTVIPYCGECLYGSCRGRHERMPCDECKGEGSFPACVKCGKRNFDPEGNPLLCEDCGAEDQPTSISDFCPCAALQGVPDAGQVGHLATGSPRAGEGLSRAPLPGAAVNAGPKSH
jgi:hypothetical protein